MQYQNERLIQGKTVQEYPQTNDMKYLNLFGSSMTRKSQYFMATQPKETKQKGSLESHQLEKTILFIFVIVDENPLRVCKEFYLTTLEISQTRISYFHEHVARDGTP